MFDWMNVWLKAAQRARNLARLLCSERINGLIVFTGDLEDMAAAWWAARRNGCALIPVMDDDYVYQWSDPVRRWCAKVVEPKALRSAAGIFTISEFSQDEYKRRYGTDSVVLYSPTPCPVGLAPERVSARKPPEAARILFSGSVYHVNFDAISMLLTGLSLLPESTVRLHIHTPQDPAILERRGIAGPVDVLPSLGPADVTAAQRDADILFLPLGFESGVPEVLRTSCPTKLSDYLVSGRPILAYAPPDTFLSWFVKKTCCGVLVDRQDATAIADAVRRLTTDMELRVKVVSNAFAAAADRWDAAKVRNLMVDSMRRWVPTPGSR